MSVFGFGFYPDFKLDISGVSFESKESALGMFLNGIVMYDFSAHCPKEKMEAEENQYVIRNTIANKSHLMDT